jgi:hypothetical protein
VYFAQAHTTRELQIGVKGREMWEIASHSINEAHLEVSIIAGEFDPVRGEHIIMDEGNTKK